MLSSVDLPQPLGPMMATNSPSFTSMFTPLSAVVSTSSVRNTFVKFSVLSIIVGSIYINYYYILQMEWVSHLTTTFSLSPNGS